MNKKGIIIERMKKYVLRFAVLIVILLLWLPWPIKFKIFKARIPDSINVIEIWERPQFDLLTLTMDYKTWFVCKADNEKRRWFLIAEEYLTFQIIAVFISNDMNHLRIETNEWGKAETHLIAEYNLKEKTFKLTGGESARNKPGWKLIAEKKVRE
jgi:hypothetical protein